MTGKKFKKEIIGVLAGIAFAYAWQLFFLFVCFKCSKGFVITNDMFVPSTTILVVFVPIVAWTVMGILRVSWFEKWKRVTIHILSFFIPFTLISVATVYVAPSLWDKTIYWVANVLISVMASAKFRDSDDVKVILSAVNEKS